MGKSFAYTWKLTPLPTIEAPIHMEVVLKGALDTTARLGRWKRLGFCTWFPSVLFQFSSRGHCIPFLLQCNNLPHTTHTYYHTVSQPFNGFLLRLSQDCNQGVGQAEFSSEAHVGKDGLLSSLRFWQNSFSWSHAAPDGLRLPRQQERESSTSRRASVSL